MGHRGAGKMAPRRSGAGAPTTPEYLVVKGSKKTFYPFQRRKKLLFTQCVFTLLLFYGQTFTQMVEKLKKVGKKVFKT